MNICLLSNEFIIRDVTLSGVSVYLTNTKTFLESQGHTVDILDFGRITPDLADRYDFIECQSWGALNQCVKNKIKQIAFRVHGSGLLFPRELPSPDMEKVRALLKQNPEITLFASSEYAASILRTMFDNPVKVVYIPIDYVDTGVECDDSVLFCGRYDPKKGIAKFAKFCAVNKLVPRILTNNKTAAVKFSHLLKQHKLRTDLISYGLTGSTKYRWMQTAQCSFSFSISETFGMAIAEALFHHNVYCAPVRSQYYRAYEELQNQPILIDSSLLKVESKRVDSSVFSHYQNLVINSWRSAL